MAGSEVLSTLSLWGREWLPVLLGTTVKASLLLVATMLVMPLFRRAAAATRHMVLFSALLAVSLLLPLSVIVPSWNVGVLWFPAPFEPGKISELSSGQGGTDRSPGRTYPIEERRLTASGALIGEAGKDRSPEATTTPSQLGRAAVSAVGEANVVREVILAGLLVIWGVGVVITVLTILCGLASLRRLERRAFGGVSSELKSLLHRLCEEIGFRRKVMLLQSDLRTIPMTWSLFPGMQPRLLLPHHADEWPQKRKRAVILHELAHVMRRDYLTQLIAELSCALQWFNPLVWWAAMRMRREREQACDDFVLRRGCKASDYAEHLIYVASGSKPAFLAAYSAVTTVRSSRLTRRVKAILESNRNRRPMSRRGTITALGLTLGLAFPLAALHPGTSSEELLAKGRELSAAKGPLREGPPPVAWQTRIGGSGLDIGYDVRETKDGGFVVLGVTNSQGAGGLDVYLVKTDSSGSVVWEKTFGGPGYDAGLSLQETKDGGYVLAGWTESFGAGGVDGYLVKTDNSGNQMWYKTYGGTYLEEFYSVAETSDGGYVMVGKTTSFGKGDVEVYMVKTDHSGEVLWQKKFGGKGYDEARAVAEVSGGGYLLAGTSDYWGSKGSQILIIRTDPSGNLQWKKNYGRDQDDRAFALHATPDGGCVVGGYTSRTNRYGGGVDEAYVIKTNAQGEVEWELTYPLSGHNYVFSVRPGRGVAYVLAGSTTSLGRGKYGIYISAVTTHGRLSWLKTVGGKSHVRGAVAQEVSDGGFVVVGEVEDGRTRVPDI